MASYTLTGPDGQSATLTAPDDADQAGIMAKLNQVKAAWHADRAEPDAPTWLGRRIQDIQGKHDPKFKDLGTVYDQFPQDLHNSTGMGAVLGASDDQMGDIVQKNLGPSFVRREKDANGYDVFVTKGPNGGEQRGYLNKPGLDMQDVSRGVYGALPYAAGGAELAAAKGLGLGAKMIAGAVSAPAVSMTGDALQGPLGSQQGVEFGKAAVTSVAGAAGPLLGAAGGALWRRFVEEPKYFNRATSTLTDEGRQVAQQMGLDPRDMASEMQRTFAKTYAASPNDAAKFVDSGALDFNVPTTVGQRTKDPQALMLEKAMRHGLRGEPAKSVITGLDNQQQYGLQEMARDTVPNKLINQPSSNLFRPANATKAFDASNIQSTLQNAKGAAKAAETAAWDDTSPIFAGAGAAPMLKESVRNSLGDLAHVLDESNTPVAYRMAKRLADFMEGNAPNDAMQTAFALPKNTSVDAMRRSIGMMTRDAQTPTDKAAAGAIYDGYNSWLQDAANAGALSGDTAAMAKFNNAIDISRNIKGIFSARRGGSATPSAKIIDKVMNEDTPERVISALFTGPRAGIKEGSIDAIRQIMRAIDTYGKPGDADVMRSSLKMAHYSSLIYGKDGEMHSAQVMLNNFRTAFTTQKSLTNEIYTPQDTVFIRRMMRTLQDVAYKDPNPSGTATGVAVMTKQLFGKIIDMAGPVGRAAVEYSGIPKAWGKAVANRAVSQAPPSVATHPLRALPPLTNALANTAGRQYQ